MNRIYISGPVTTVELLNYPAFERASAALAAAGYEVIVPHDLVNPEDSHETAMLLCLNELTERETRRAFSQPVPRYDGLALLPGWEQSEGARLEKAVAEACGIPCKTVDEWIEEAR